MPRFWIGRGRALTFVALAIALVAVPGVGALILYERTGNPLWRYLAITEDRLARAVQDVGIEGPYVRIRIYWAGDAAGFDSGEALARALRATFENKGVEAHVAVLSAAESPHAAQIFDNAPQTTIDMRAGRNSFGPFSVDSAARYVNPAVAAARFAYVPETPEPETDFGRLGF